MVTFRVKVPVFLGYDERYNIHYFHEDQTQEVELSGWYLPDKDTVELSWGMNLYTGFDMHPEWVRALNVDPNWSFRLSQAAKTAYAELQDE
jgi:hypothetical protein